MDRDSAAHYLRRGVVLFGTDWTESRGRVLLVVNQLLVTFFVLYMAAVWIILSARSAKLSHTEPWSICVGKLEGFRGVLDLGLCTVLGRDLPKYLSLWVLQK